MLKENYQNNNKKNKKLCFRACIQMSEVKNNLFQPCHFVWGCIQFENMPLSEQCDIQGAIT